MIPVCLYVAPLPGGCALVAPPAAVNGVAGAAAVLSRHPDAVRVEVIAPDAAPIPGLNAQMTHLLARVAAAAAMPVAPPPRGPRGRWYAALVIWGWLLLLAADGNLGQVVAGLWLAVGLPLVRAAYHRGVLRWAAGAAAGYQPVTAPVEVRHVEHAGLRRIAFAMEEHAGEPQTAYEAAAALCAAAGPLALGPFYRNLVEGVPVGGVWATLPRPAPVAATEPAGEPAAPTTDHSVPTPSAEPAAAAADQDVARQPDGAQPEGEQPRTSSTPISAPTA